MKNFIIAALLLSLTACSNSNNDPKSPEIPASQIENLDAFGIGFFSGSPLSDQLEIDMLEVQVGVRSNLSVTIKNMGTSATNIRTASIPTTNGFYITSSTCASKSLPANGGSCSLILNFSGIGKIAGQTYTNTLSFGSSSVPVKIKVVSPPPPPPAQLAFFDGPAQLSSSLDLGPYPNDITLAKTLSVKNIGAGPSSTLSLQLLNNIDGWYLTSNGCANVALAAGASCSFSLRVSTTGKSRVRLTPVP